MLSEKIDMNDDPKAKHEFIKAFHDDAENRIEFLAWFHKEKHQQEALTLCLTYIDSFAQWLCWPSSASGKNFVNAVVDYGGNSLMGLIHPLQATRAFENLKSSWKDISIKIKEVFPGPEYELIPKDDFLAKLNTSLRTEEMDKLKTECWRGTLAATAYYFLRNPSVHSFGASELSFSGTVYQGERISNMGFVALYDILKNIHYELRRRSESNIEWFGDDRIVGIGA
jgi:hypothetical protein